MFSPVLDKLSVVLPYAARTEYNDHERLIAALLPNFDALMANGTLVKIPHSRRGYQHVFLANVGNPDGHRPIIRIGSQNPAACNGAVAFNLNPSHHSPTELNTFAATLLRVFGDNPQTLDLFRRARLQSLHSALDVPGLELDWLMVDNQRSRKFETYATLGDADRPGRITGLYFNQLGSDSRTCIYQKDIERRYRLVEAMKGAKTEQEQARVVALMQTVLDGKPVTRVECRWDKLNGLPLHLAHTMTNRFALLDFRYIDPEQFDLSKDIGRAMRLEANQLIHYVRAVGIEKTLKDYQSLYGSETLYRRTKRLLDKSEIKLCDPGKAFNQTIDALKALPFFPAEAFDNPNDCAGLPVYRASSPPSRKTG